MLPTLCVLIGLVTGIGFVAGDIWAARTRAISYFKSVDMRVVRLKLQWARLPSSRFLVFGRRLIFCAYLEDSKGAAIPAWVASAGIFGARADDALEVRFSPTGAFPDNPEP